jgi:PAS domain S-box-containing protein
MTLSERVQDLLARLHKAEEAIRSGKADETIAVDRISELRRVILEGMSEGALALSDEGEILFSNQPFATIVETPLETVIGSRIHDFVVPDDLPVVDGLLRGDFQGQSDLRLLTSQSAMLPAAFSIRDLQLDQGRVFCLIITDLREQKHNAELAAAETFARSILEQAAEAIVVIGPDGAIRRANRAADHLAGVQVLNRTLDEIFPVKTQAGVTVDSFRQILDESGSNDLVGKCEFQAWTPDGRAIDLLLSATFLSGPEPGARAWLVHLQDMTGRRVRERQLKFQASILDNTSDAVIAVDPARRVIYWNQAAESLYQVARADAIGRTLSELHSYLWSDREQEDRMRAGLAEKDTWSGEYVHTRKDGARIIVSATVNRIPAEHGGGVFAVVRDITESRASEARVRSRAAELEAIMEAVPMGIAIARDPLCRSITGNRMLYRMLRDPVATNISKTQIESEPPGTWQERKDGRDLLPEELPMQIAARTGRPVHDFEMEIVFDDGISRYWLGDAVPLLGEAGKPQGAIGAWADITERKHAEERLRQSQKWESVGVLAGGIAHDFNNLLVGVLGNASLALDSLPPNDPAGEFMRNVIVTGEKLANLTGQLLAYAGQGRFVIESMDLSDLVSETAKLFQPSISDNIVVHLELNAKLPPVAADRRQAQQLFLSLAHNAAEAIGDAAGVITVRSGLQTVDSSFLKSNPGLDAMAAGPFVYLEVCDTGCGMDAATKARIFDPFFSTKFLGRGLGLAAASGIVRGHNGAIRVSSEPGKGSCFTIYFPAAPIYTAAAPVAATEEPSLDGVGTVVLVDDEEVVRATASSALNRHGYKVLLATNSNSAMDLLSRYRNDVSLVILDLTMPEMSGQDLLPKLRAIHPGVKVLVSSGYDEAEAMAMFKEQPVSGFIQKPYTSRKLAEKVRSILT